MRSMIAGFVVLVSACAVAQEIQLADVRNVDTDEGYFVVFVSKRVAEGDPIGHAVMAVGRGETADGLEYEFVYGMLVEEGEPTVGELPLNVVEAVRSSEEGEPARTFVVNVDAAQYARALELLKTCAANADDPDLTPAALLHEAAHMVVLGIGGLKEPYRGGGRRSPDMQTYFEDLTVLNRNK